MICQVAARIANLTVEDVLNPLRRALELRLPLPDSLTVRDFLYLICTVGYSYEEWRGKIDLYLTLTDLNSMINIIEQAQYKPIYTSSRDFADCITFRKGDEELPLVICNDPEMYPDAVRIVKIRLDKLCEIVQVRFTVQDSRGQELYKYVSGTYIVETTLAIPLYYVLNVSKLTVEDIVRAYAIALKRGLTLVDDSVIAYALAYTMRDVSRLTSAHYFVHADDIRKIARMLRSVYIEEHNGRVTLLMNNDRLLSCARLEDKLMRVVYIDVEKCLRYGIDFKPVKLCTY